MATEPIMADLAPTTLDTLPQPNLPLLRKVLDHVDAHPKDWDQAFWGGGQTAGEVAKCGTSMCLSGWAQYLSGADRIGFGTSGEQVLGLTDDEAEDLFVNTLDGREMRVVADCPSLSIRERVQRVAEAIAARAGERL